MELITVYAYAKYRGVSKMAVQKAVKDGRITLTKGKINPELADKQWEENTDQNYIRQYNAFDSDKDRRSSVPPFAESRSIREAYQSRIAKIDYEEKLGKVVNAEAVEKRNIELWSRVKNHLLIFPSRIANELINCKTPFEIQTIIEKEINKALEEFVSGIRKNS